MPKFPSEEIDGIAIKTEEERKWKRIKVISK